MSELVHGHDEGHDPVRPGLGPSIERMEGEGSEGAREDERVMQLVDGTIQEIRVESVMDPVDAEIRNDEKDGDRESPVEDRQGEVVEEVKFEVKLSVALLQSQMDGRVDSSNDKNRDKSDPELTLDLAYIKFE